MLLITTDLLKQLYLKVSIMNLFEMFSLRLNMKLSISFIIFIALCLAGCLYHVIEITDVYLKYQTKVDVSFDGDSQIVVPLVTFCRMKEASYRNIEKPMQMQNPTPSLIDNITYDVSEIFFLYILVTDNHHDGIAVHQFEKLQDYGVQVEKTINYRFICYNFKHFQFSKYKPRINGRIYEFMLYQHNHFNLIGRMKDHYNLYLTSEKRVPNGQSINSLKLIGNFYKLNIYKNEIL